MSIHMGRVGLLLLALALATEATAERNYIVGTTMDIAGGLGNTSFYSAYPSIDLQSVGNHSVFGMNYTFGLNRQYDDIESHVASVKYSHSYNRLRLNLSETFEKTPDITSLNVIRGVAFDPQAGFRYLFDPVAIRRSTRVNTTTVATEYILSRKSSISVGVSHAQRQYGDNPLLQGRLSDQYRLSGNVTYTRKHSERSSWGLEYMSTYYHFNQYGIARSNAIGVDYSHRFGPTLSLRAAGGPSYTQIGPTTKYVSYNASLTLEKVVGAHTVSMAYSRSGGESTGYGSISQTDSVTIYVPHHLNQKTTASLTLSVYDGHGKTSDAFETRGTVLSGTIERTLNERVSLKVGSRFTKYGSVSVLGFSEDQLFFSFKFREPRLLKFSR